MSVRQLPKVYTWQPTRPAGRVLGWLLVVVGAFSFVEALFQLDRALTASSLTGTREELALKAVWVIQTPITFVSAPVILACEVLWLIWQHKVNADLWARGAVGLRFTPGWSVGWWFVPLASLVQPFRAMRELARRAGRPAWGDPAKEPVVGDGTLGLWWASFLGYGLVSVPALVIWFGAVDGIFGAWSIEAIREIETVQGSDLRAMAWWLCASAIVRGAAALLAARVVWSISRAEDRAVATLVGVPPRPDL
jgi:uncharacterized protein DUF4328